MQPGVGGIGIDPELLVDGTVTRDATGKERATSEKQEPSENAAAADSGSDEDGAESIREGSFGGAQVCSEVFLELFERWDFGKRLKGEGHAMNIDLNSLTGLPSGIESETPPALGIG